MPARGNVFQKGNFYHIYNRGEKVFFYEENYHYCISLLNHYTEKYHIDLLAYCLMPNHYHFLVKQEGDYPISKWVGVVFNQYAQRINHQTKQRGPLFESRFKHILIDKENYLLEICRYIHLNPVKAKLVKNPSDWIGSDYVRWISPNYQNPIKQSYFKGINNYSDFVMSKFEDNLPVRYLFS